MDEEAKPEWYEHEKNEARGFKLRPPYDRIVVGCDPRDGMTKETADSFDVFVNVSDSPCALFEPSRPGQHMHWYPVNECGRWNLSYLFWLKRVLDHHYDAGHRVYLHCHAGAYRSPSAAVLWLQGRGLSYLEAAVIAKEGRLSIFRQWEDLGNVPEGYTKFFERMREHPTQSLAGIMLETEKRLKLFPPLEVIAGENWYYHVRLRLFWWYYEPKWWLKNQLRRLKDWGLNRYGYTRDGICTTYYARRYFWSRMENAERMPDDEWHFLEQIYDTTTRSI